MESEDDAASENSWQSYIAAPGGDDEEVLTFDLTPGTYGLVCFISGADGTPHAFMGMTEEITVT
jgi:plastocyanin